jgi:hypothetical protein
LEETNKKRALKEQQKKTAPTKKASVAKKVVDARQKSK